MSPRRFGIPELFLALALLSLLGLNLKAAISHSQSITQLNNRDLVVSTFVTFAIVFFIAAFLKLRGFNLESLGGFSRVRFARVLATGVILLLAAIPLINLAEAWMQRAFGTGSGKQEIIELFNSSQTIGQRILIIVLAVAVAPITEEFVFRFFLYGLLKRYFGRFFGLMVNALLFAAAHAHLPSFAPLFVLGVCFTLAYEWSGSILVSMTMHSLFNSITLALLAFPQIFDQ